MADDITPGDDRTPEAPQPAEAPEPAEAPGPADDKHSLKDELREGAAKAFGLAVEVGSMLSGESGELADAERELAAAEAEEFIDRIDGEG